MNNYNGVPKYLKSKGIINIFQILPHILTLYQFIKKMNQVLNENSWNSIPSAPLYQLLALQLALTEPMQDGIELSARAALASCNRELLAQDLHDSLKSENVSHESGSDLLESEFDSLESEFDSLECNRELLAHNFPRPPAKSRKMTALVGIVWGRSFSGNCLGKKF